MSAPFVPALTTRAKLLLRGLRYAELFPFASIDGFLAVDEAIALFELARSLPHEAPRVAEIGSWQGKSAVAISRGLRGKRNPRLFCVDPLDASGDPESRPRYEAQLEAASDGLRARLEANLCRAEVRELVEIRQGRSHDVAPTVAEPLDMLFLDGDHSHGAVLQDYEDWAPKVRPGGFLCLHDVVHPEHVGPRRVVEEVIRRDPRWVDCRQVVSMFIARRSAA